MVLGVISALVGIVAAFAFNNPLIAVEILAIGIIFGVFSVLLFAREILWGVNSLGKRLSNQQQILVASAKDAAATRANAEAHLGKYALDTVYSRSLEIEKKIDALTIDQERLRNETTHPNGETTTPLLSALKSVDKVEPGKVLIVGGAAKCGELSAAARSIGLEADCANYEAGREKIWNVAQYSRILIDFTAPSIQPLIPFTWIDPDAVLEITASLDPASDLAKLNCGTRCEFGVISSEKPVKRVVVIREKA